MKSSLSENDKNGGTTVYVPVLVQVIKDIFEKYHFHKLIFNAVIGNPAREKYTKIIERFGGRIVGIAKEDIYMYGKYYDKIIYEVLKSDYDNMKEKNGL